MLVNNASIFEYDTVRTATRDSWDRHMASNLRAPFVLTQALAEQVPDPVVDDRQEPVAQGLVINMLDQKIRKLTPEHMTYTIAKMGLWTIHPHRRAGLAPRVRMNAIGPGPTLQGRPAAGASFHRPEARHHPRTRIQPGRHHRRGGLPARRARGHRPMPVRRWRTAPRLADAG